MDGDNLPRPQLDVHQDRFAIGGLKDSVKTAPLAAARNSSGRPISDPDARVAAIARSRGAELATRNVADFAGCELEVINPWL